MLNSKRPQPRLLNAAKLAITINGENQAFNNKTKFKQHLTTNPTLQKVVKGNSNPKRLIAPKKIRGINNPRQANT